MMKSINIFICLFFLLILISTYQNHNTENHIWNFYEQNSYLPVIHVHYNHHFYNSKQFQEFLEVVEEIQYRNGDYVKFMFTDCEAYQKVQKKTEGLYGCNRIKKTKENRLIVGFWPSDQFINYGGKLMQNPPNNKVFDHPSDRYTVEQFESFIQGMLPNFFKELTNIDQWKEFKQSRYVPKLIYFSGEDETPKVLNKLSVFFYLKFDFAFVSDLTQSIINELNITNFPALFVMNYNYQDNIYELQEYPSTDFSSAKYEQIKSYLEPYALTQQRNDILFHKIHMPKNLVYNTVDNKGQFNRFLDKSSLWTIVSQYKQNLPPKLNKLKEKYGKYFEYLHLMSSDAQEQKLSLHDPQHKKLFNLKEDKIEFKSLTGHQFISNASVWLNKNFVLIGVRQQYAHLCTLSLAVFFRGFTQCLVVKEEDRQFVEKDMGVNMDFGFVSSLKWNKTTGKPSISGMQFKNPSFQQVYYTSEYQVRLKSKSIIDDFMETPIKHIPNEDELKNICSFPTKKCGLVFVDSNKKDQTTKEYVAEIAKNMINDYQFYEIDINCNQQFLEQIQGLKKQKGGLVVYHPRNGVFVFLKAKLSKNNIQRFLKINLTENKKLPKTKFQNEKIKIHDCKSKKEPEPTEQQQSQQSNQL